MATSAASCLSVLHLNPNHPSSFIVSSTAARCSLPPSEHPRASRLVSLVTTRRQLAGHLLLSLLIVPALPSIASDENPGPEDFKEYADDNDKYSLLIPPNWIKGTGQATGQRNVTAFFPVEDTSANVNVLMTALGADYTSLGSFGTVDTFAETLVNGLDRSWKKPPGQVAQLVNFKSSNGLYYVEYTVQRPGEKKRHLVSVVGVRFNGWYNRLYTVTGQYWEDDKVKYGPLLEKVVESFKFA